MLSATGSVLPRHDNLDVLSQQVKYREDLGTLMKDNEALQFIVSKYNIILTEYPKKYGNELFLEIDKVLSNNDNMNIPNYTMLNQNDIVSLKRNLVERISLFKEYEKKLLDKDQKLTLLNKDLTRVQSAIQNMLVEKEELQKENAKLIADTNELTALINVNEVNVDDSNNIQQQTFNNNVQRDVTLLRSKNQKMKNEITELKTKIAQYETDYNDLTSKLNAYTQNKIKDEMEYHNLKDENTAISNDIQRIQNIINVKTLEILELQNNKTKHKSREDNLRSENDLYKKENTNFKNVYDELAKRKAIQINALTNENDELKNEISSLKRKLKTKDETESEQIFEIAKLKQENAIMKSDIEHLTKIIDDSAFAVKTANEKEQHVDTLIKNYKQKLDDALLEKDKALIKHKHQETQLNKLTNEYTAIARDKALIYDNMLASSKRKYDELIQAKNDEIAQIKTDILGYKMEKDKYQSDYGLLLNEYEKIKNNYHIDNNTYISKYEDIQRKSVATSKEYENNIMKLNIAIDHLETENKTFQAEINSFKQNEKLREAQFTQITKNENDLRKQLNKIKEKLFMFNKDNERLRSEIELQKDLYESKIGNVKEEYDIKIIRMENVINQQKEQLGLIEGRTYGMLKKQEKLTEKFKKEYFNTIDFYEAKIKEIQSEDVNGENTHAIVCEEDVE